ncbi:MAG: hypothetical protein R2822_29165 [Spirosomataceae bacterium]
MNPKRHIAIFLLLLISFKILVVPFIYLDFELRKEYIIQNLCENRFKPELHCDGQCYLAKTLTKIAEEKAQNEAEKQGQNIKKVLEEVFEVQEPVFLAILLLELPQRQLFYYKFHATEEFAASLYHHPAFVL